MTKKLSKIPKDAKVVRAPRVVKVPLSEEKLEKTSHELAEKLRDVEVVKDDMKAQSAVHRERLKGLAAEVKVLGEAILTGEREEEKECEIIYDYAANRVLVRLIGDDRIVDERPMTEEDRQEALL